MVYALPESTLSFLKPLLSELLTKSVLMVEPSANITDMDDLDKVLFLNAINRQANEEYVSFEDALAASRVGFNEL